MKKKTRIISVMFVFAFVFSLIVIFSGCQPNGGKTSSKTGSNVIKKYFWNQPTEDEKAEIQYIKDTTGIEVQYTIVPWEQLETKTLSDISAGLPADLIFVSTSNFPRASIKKILKPIDEIKGYDDKEFVSKDEIKSARSIFSWAGRSYVVTGGVEPALIYYNKTMFDAVGVTTPIEYYNKGEWNFENFRKVATSLVADTNGDGKSDQMGFATWRYDLFVIANGGKYVDFTKDSNIAIKMEEAPSLNAMKFLQDSYLKDKYQATDGNVTWTDNFINGKNAMISDGLYVGTLRLNGKMKDKWDIAPFPIGPDNKEGYLPGNSYGIGICYDSKNPELALKALKASVEFFDKRKAERKGILYETFSKEQEQLIDKLRAKVQIDLSTGIGNWQKLSWDMFNAIKAGTAPASSVAKYKPVLQGQIDLTIKDTIKPEVKPFSGVTKIDFEGATTDSVAFTDANGNKWGTTSLDIVSGADAIDGKSLKIIRDKSSEWQLGIRTLKDKWVIPAYGHKYKVTFNYKTIGSPSGTMYVTLAPDNNIGKEEDINDRITQELEQPSGKFEGEFEITSVSDNLSLIIGGRMLPDIVVDNLFIEEIK